ncbi:MULTISPECIES: oligoendopeptidase F [Lysinibacillus]|uniref:Oligopeptidase F n=1 Tax=Lysinibacillus boronitolerans JCM 21713 = 10a = NBRC 103108 TaxID=1294264 RepID=A0ABR4Y3G3_9BACI|nr:oligoendopeptidase F [Lysinibacillus boronitolerans]KGR87478.1 oligoendopeptidase F [Lysinibacillus boronitolerans JCM 21713 = 10a = NBRC 103108]MCS1393670.1 oligoendopeptidase F [Lysinibacillus boronitolerans]
MKVLPLRKDVAVEETWDLTDLLSNEADFEPTLAQLVEDALSFEQQYKGTITNAQKVIDVLTAFEELQKKFVPIGTYASLNLETDRTNDVAQMRAAKFGTAIGKVSSALSFVRSELLALDEAVLQEAAALSPLYKRYLEELLKQKPHQLHPEVEKALAAFSATFDAPYKTYNTTKLVDMDFGEFEANGEKHPLSFVLYENDWEFEANTDVRRAAFQAFSSKLRDYQHTTAQVYNTHIQQEKTMADLRGFNSVIDYLLFDQDVDRSLYNRQIDLITKELAPHMRRYATLIQKANGIDQMTFADLKIALDPEYDPRLSMAEAKEYVEKALAVMGEDYNQLMERAFNERWIDYAPNKGKSTGAFCSSPYGSHPYILMSWNEQMNEVFTLIHELGHAGHFANTYEHQSYLNSRPSLYFIEAPSTMNEMLLANYLLTHNDDLRFKRWVISNIVAKTYYHNFVTHLLEAAYQRKVYELIDAGEAVNATILNQLKRSVLEDFWGDTVAISEGAELTWMRQPHYYMGLYPYTYSAGLTISTQVSQRILKEGAPAVEDWLAVLRAGGTKSPVELAQMAGVDITTDQPLRDTIAYIGHLIDELERLTVEIEAVQQ